MSDPVSDAMDAITKKGGGNRHVRGPHGQLRSENGADLHQRPQRVEESVR